MSHSPELQAGLGILSYSLGRLIDTPEQAAARAREAQRRQDRRVACPRCHALPGQPCTAPSGRTASREHKDRAAASRVDHIL